MILLMLLEKEISGGARRHFEKTPRKGLAVDLAPPPSLLSARKAPKVLVG